MRRALWAATILLLVIGVPILTIALWVHSRTVYRRYFGDYCLCVSLGSYMDAGGKSHRMLVTSYYDPPQLARPALGGTFPIPDSRKPQFDSVYDESHSLFCIYDTNGWGYIAIVNIQTGEGYASAPERYRTRNTVDWRDEFYLLKETHPELPYEEIFAGAERQGDNPDTY